MGRYGKWIIAALSLSLMVNVFAAGHLLGGGMRAKSGAGKPEFSRGFPRGAYKTMPEAAREAFRQSLKDTRESVRKSKREARMLRETLPDIIGRSGPLDEAALKERFAKLRAVDSGLQSGFERALLSALAAMSEEERATFAAQLREDSKRKRKGPRMGQGPGEGPGNGPREPRGDGQPPPRE